MDQTDTSDPGSIQPFHGPHPQPDIRTERILYEYGNGISDSFQGGGGLLHQERTGCRPCSYPEEIEASFQTFLNLTGTGDFRADHHSKLFADF